MFPVENDDICFCVLLRAPKFFHVAYIVGKDLLGKICTTKNILRSSTVLVYRSFIHLLCKIQFNCKLIL